MVSIATIQLCLWTVKAAIDYTEANEHGSCILTKLYLKQNRIQASLYHTKKKDGIPAS